MIKAAVFFLIGYVIGYSIINLAIIFIDSIQKRKEKREKMVDKTAFEKTLERLSEQLNSEQR